MRRAAEGEQLVTLDDQMRTLVAEDCLIADDDGPAALAGVMGGERSEVSDTTTRVLLEVANWHGPAIHATSTRLGLRSRGQHALREGPRARADDGRAGGRHRAAARASPARGVLPGTIDVGGAGPGRPPSCACARRRVDAAARRGDRRASEQAEHLRALGFGVAEAGDGLDVTVPYWRREDVTREADLVEEIARLHGVNENLPATLPSRARRGRASWTPEQRLRRRAEDVLVGRGLHEIAGWSFADRARAGPPAPPGRHPLPRRRRDREPDERGAGGPAPDDRSARCSTPRAATSRAAPRDLGLFESAAVYLARARPSRPTSTTRSARC